MQVCIAPYSSQALLPSSFSLSFSLFLETRQFHSYFLAIYTSMVLCASMKSRNHSEGKHATCVFLRPVLDFLNMKFSFIF